MYDSAMWYYLKCTTNSDLFLSFQPSLKKRKHDPNSVTDVPLPGMDKVLVLVDVSKALVGLPS